MKHIGLLSVLAVLALGAALAGCQTINPTTGDVVKVTDVRTAAVAACGFLPTAETVASIIRTNDPKLATASAIAEAICAAITAKPSNSGAVTLFSVPSVPKVNGVPIKGVSG